VDNADRTNQLTRLEQIYLERGPLLDDINQVAPWHAIYRRRTLELLSVFLTPSTRLLDLAAGTGIFSRALSDRVGSLTLVDALSTMLDKARANFEAAGLLRTEHKIRFLQHDLTSDSDDDDQLYDLVILTQALNFIAAPEKLFRYVARHLAPAGVFYFDIDTAFRWAVIEALSLRVGNALHIAEEKRDIERRIVGAEYFFYDRFDIEQALEAAGLTVSKVRGLCYVSPFVHVFNASADFLVREQLDSRAATFLDPKALSELQRLDRIFEHKLPPEVAGWMSFESRRVRNE